MPFPLLPEMTFAAAALPPMALPVAPLPVQQMSMPLDPFATAPLRLALRPIVFPCTEFPVVPGDTR